MMHMLDKEGSGTNADSLDDDWVQLPAESLEGTRKNRKGSIQITAGLNMGSQKLKNC